MKTASFPPTESRSAKRLPGLGYCYHRERRITDDAPVGSAEHGRLAEPACLLISGGPSEKHRYQAVAGPLLLRAYGGPGRLVLCPAGAPAFEVNHAT